MAVVLKRGMKHAQVKRIQQLLNDALGLRGNQRLPGIENYGPKTETAVKQFQQQVGMRVNGQVDAPTLELLEEYASQPGVCEETPWDWPLASNKIRRGLINHTFGMVRKYADGRRKPHQGWDFEAAIGTETYAISDGTVVFVKDSGAYGKQVCVHFRHNGVPRYAFYAHLKTWYVKPGQDVVLGEMIGLTGESGNAQGMARADQHLHFEIRQKEVAGLGLAGRESPLGLFGTCPLHAPVAKKFPVINQCLPG